MLELGYNLECQLMGSESETHCVMLWSMGRVMLILIEDTRVPPSCPRIRESAHASWDICADDKPATSVILTFMKPHPSLHAGGYIYSAACCPGDCEPHHEITCQKHVSPFWSFRYLTGGRQLEQIPICSRQDCCNLAPAISV
jgi:hypothetical protein